MAEIKDMIQYLRKSHGLTQQELAESLHISSSTIAMYETGKRFPTKEIEEAIADFFNVNLSTLRGREKNYKVEKEDVFETKYNSLSEKNKIHILNYMDLLIKEQQV